MKILYLFNRVRTGLEEKISSGNDHDGHFFGMFRLKQQGIEAEYLELEQFFSAGTARFIRRHILNIHYVHLLLFLKMRKYDVVFSSTAFGSLFVKAVLSLKRPKWVEFDYGIKSMIGSGQTLKQKILKFMVGRADGIITISPGEKNAMIAFFPHLDGCIEYIPLGVDTAFFTPDFSAENASEENFILSPGRDPGRDVRILAEATKGLAVVSDGLACEVKITAREGNIKKLGTLPEHVKRYDFSPLELRDEYRRAKLVIIPLTTKGGLNDAMGCSTLVEAMAMGKAVIATATETMSAYITHGENGWLVPEGDAGALRLAIEKLLGDRELRLRLGRSAREFAVTECSADIFAGRLGIYFKKNFTR